MKELGAGIALYGPDVGIGLITTYAEIAGGDYQVGEVAARSGKTAGLFAGKASCRIRVHAAHDFASDGVRFGGVSQFAARLA